MGNNYSRIEKIAEGTFGIVYKAYDKRTNKIVAIKKSKWDMEGVDPTSIREMSILKQLSHRNIVQVQDMLFDDVELYLVFEYLPMSLGECIRGIPPDGHMDPMVVKGYLYQILLAVHFCHQRGVMHRDLKPDNVLLDHHGVIKISDFELSRPFCTKSKVYTHEVVTMWYRAPEVLLGEPKYSSAIDIWSVGCIFAEMITKKPLFPGDSEIDQLFQIFRILTTPTEKTWPGVTKLPDYNEYFPKWTNPELRKSVSRMENNGFELLQACLTYNPKQRISARRALQDNFKYFKDLDVTGLPGYSPP